MKELYQKVALALESAIPEFENDSFMFSQKGYESFAIDEKNFRMIHDMPQKNTLCFVDGGNAELFASASFSVQFVRIHATFYQNNKRIKTRRKEFFILLHAVNKEGVVHYRAQSFADHKESTRYEWEAHNVYTHTTPPLAISEVGNVVRRISELECAQECVQDLGENDCVVLDGNLQTTFVHESDAMTKLCTTALESNVVVSALAKTSKLLTSNANSVTAVLARLCNGSWVYHPVAEITNANHRAEMCFVKLHEKSDYVFRLDIFKPQKESMHTIVAQLKHNASDPTFLGYPYGLIDADRFARVTNQEKEQLRVRIKGMLSKDLQPYLSSLNAHSILDSIG